MVIFRIEKCRPKAEADICNFCFFYFSLVCPRCACRRIDRGRISKLYQSTQNAAVWFSRRKAVRTAQVRKVGIRGTPFLFLAELPLFKINAAQKPASQMTFPTLKLKKASPLAATVSTWRWTWLGVTGRCRTFSKFAKTFSSENKIRTRKTKSAKRQRHCASQPIFSTKPAVGGCIMDNQRAAEPLYSVICPSVGCFVFLIC